MAVTEHAAAAGTALAAWATKPRDTFAATTTPAGLRFAFYGRVSTEDHQDPATSKGWQLLHAQALTSGHGRIVAEFFDVGHSRSLPWARRPDAAALVAALADPNRGFDSIVIGSSERAFNGQQFATMAPLFAHYGVSVWLPELGGEVDPEIAAHDELMVLLGIISKREVVRARMRARTSMAVQAREQGRYLGGRPPFAYRLVDAGPHPNRAWARRGARAQRLDVDPTNGPVVTWMFQQRLAGHSMARITRALNDMKIPCPAAADRERNPHRTAAAWTLTSVHSVLSNPRYTGRQVWNRQRTDHDLVDPDNTTLGHRDVMRRNTPEDWVISQKQAHPALVSEADFVAAQGIRTDKSAPEHTYHLAGLLRCGHCRRRMESCWSNGRAAYRCRHGHSSATPRDPNRTPNAYAREDQILARLPALHLMRTGEDAAPDPAGALARLRADGISLIYDQTSRTVTANTERKEKIAIAR